MTTVPNLGRDDTRSTLFLALAFVTIFGHCYMYLALSFRTKGIFYIVGQRKKMEDIENFINCPCTVRDWY